MVIFSRLHRGLKSNAGTVDLGVVATPESPKTPKEAQINSNMAERMLLRNPLIHQDGMSGKWTIPSLESGEDCYDYIVGCEATPGLLVSKWKLPQRVQKHIPCSKNKRSSETR